MTEKLETVLDKVSSIANPVNSSLIQEFYQYMVDNRKSDSYKKNNLKALVLFSQELAPNITFNNIQKKVLYGFLIPALLICLIPSGKEILFLSRVLLLLLLLLRSSGSYKVSIAKIHR